MKSTADGSLRHVAVLVRGIDGVFLAERGMRVVARVGAEAAWATRLFGAAVLPVDVPHLHETTEDFLLDRGVERALAEAGIAGLVLSVRCSESLQRWAQRRGIGLWTTAPKQQRRLEHKVWFDRFLRRHGLPVPPRARWPRPGMPPALPIVVQIADSLGGEGTFLAQTAAAVDRARQACQGVVPSDVLVRRFVAGQPLGITVFVAPGVVALSAVRWQCYHETPPGAPLCFAGVQWLPTRDLGPAARTIEAVALRIGTLLYARRFFGFANLDLLLGDDGCVHVIECNPRLSAATPQLLQHRQLAGGLDLRALYLDGFQRRRRYRPAPRLHGLPDSDYAGCTLDVVRADRHVAWVPPNGRYQWLGDRVRWLADDVRGVAGAFSTVAHVQVGDTVPPGEPWLTVLADEALHGPDGRPHDRADAVTRALWTQNAA